MPNQHTAAIMDDFWSACDQSGGPEACWPWQRAVMKNGYGSISDRGRLRSAHRVAYEAARGTIPAGVGYHGNVVRHTCDNRLCVNPAHLLLGTQLENCRDRDSRARVKNRRRGSGNHASRFTEKQVLEIYAGRARGDSYTVLMQRFGCSRGAIAAIVQKRTWGWLADTPLGQAAIARATA